MIVDRQPTVESIGKIFADAVRDDEAVREVWVAEDCEGFIISVFTDEIDIPHELQIYGHDMDVHKQFPDALFEVHVNNPRNYTFTSFEKMRSALLPKNAVRIMSRQ